MAPAPQTSAPARWRGPLRAALAVFVAGVLVVWLIKPLGDPCPDLGQLPQGSSASSSPSLSPPGTRTCTYMAAGGTRAQSRYVPWLDWIVLAMIAALVGGVIAAVSPAARGAGAARHSPARPRRPPRGRTGREPAVPTERDAAERERARRERAERDR